MIFFNHFFFIRKSIHKTSESSLRVSFITNVVLARLNGKVIPVNLAEGVKNNLDTIPSESKEVIAEDKQAAVKETEK